MKIEDIFDMCNNLSYEDIKYTIEDFKESWKLNGRKDWNPACEFIKHKATFKDRIFPIRDASLPIICGFYSEKNVSFNIEIGGQYISKEILKSNEFSYPSCNILPICFLNYHDVVLFSDDEITIEIIYLSSNRIKLEFWNNAYESHYSRFTTPDENEIVDGLLRILEGMGGTCFHPFVGNDINAIEIKKMTPETSLDVWKKIENGVGIKNVFKKIMKYKNILMKLALQRKFWECIKNDSDESQEVEKKFDDYIKVFEDLNLIQTSLFDFI